LEDWIMAKHDRERWMGILKKIEDSVVRKEVSDYVKEMKEPETITVERVVHDTKREEEIEDEVARLKAQLSQRQYALDSTCAALDEVRERLDTEKIRRMCQGLYSGIAVMICAKDRDFWGFVQAQLFMSVLIPWQTITRVEVTRRDLVALKSRFAEMVDVVVERARGQTQSLIRDAYAVVSGYLDMLLASEDLEKFIIRELRAIARPQ
jgi:hypothetical protein